MSWLIMANNPSTSGLMFPFGIFLAVMTVIVLVVSSPRFQSYEAASSYEQSQPVRQEHKVHHHKAHHGR